LGELRAYTDLAEMLHKEASAEHTRTEIDNMTAGFARDFPDYRYMVLFIEPHDPSRNYFFLMHVPSPGLRSLAMAERMVMQSGYHPVAYWMRQDQPAIIRPGNMDSRTG